MSRTSAQGPRFWIEEDGRVMQIEEGVSIVVTTLDKGEMTKLRGYGWRIGSSARRYAYNPAAIVRGSFNR